MDNPKRILVTSALPYVNNLPHLGTMVPVISADVYSRYLKYVKKVPCIFVCGTDEHGTTTQTKAEEEKATPKELCDKYFRLQKEGYDWMLCDFDCFGRTSDKENHELTIDIFNKLETNGYVLEEEIEQLKCKEHGFLADRYVSGTCPHCGYTLANGDQCESCSTMLNATELKDPLCATCKKTPHAKRTRHLFIDLPKLTPKLAAWINSTKKNWTRNAVTMTEGFLRDGLKARSITRDLQWGIPVPKKGFEDKVFYCWFDAPIGYISITKKCRDDWKTWWHKPDETRLVQCIGKDNIPFHTLMFPAFLIGTDDAYTLLDTMSSNEFMTYEGKMFSKSRGIGIFADDAKATGIRADAWRYYLMMRRPETSDTDFTWDDFAAKINNELVANLGNLVNRTITFINRFIKGALEVQELADTDIALLNDLRVEEDMYHNFIDQIKLHEGLRQLMHIARIGNTYFQDQKPWELVKTDEIRTRQVLATLCNIIKMIARLCAPYMPKAAEEITQMLGTKQDGVVLSWNIGKATLLFSKIDEKEISALRQRYDGKQKQPKQEGDLSALDIRAATILSVEDHPQADKLYVLSLDDGSKKKRQLVAGLKGYLSKEELTNKTVCFLANLKPAVLRGIESRGMILAAEKDGTLDVLDATGASPGDRAAFTEGAPKEQITFDEFAAFTITTDDEHHVTCKDKTLAIGSRPVLAKNVPAGAKVR